MPYLKASARQYIIGSVVYKINGKEIGRNNVLAVDSVEKITYGGILYDFLKKCAIIM